MELKDLITNLTKLTELVNSNPNLLSLINNDRTVRVTVDTDYLMRRSAVLKVLRVTNSTLSKLIEEKKLVAVYVPHSSEMKFRASDVNRFIKEGLNELA